MDYAAARGDGSEIVEALLAPLQELVALEVALVLDLEVALAGTREPAGHVDLDGMVDDQVDRYLRVHSLRVPAHRNHGVSQGCNVDHSRDSCEVLQYYSTGAERNLRGFHLRRPRGYPDDVFLGDEEAVALTKRRFE